jgi:hypothetical protein
VTRKIGVLHRRISPSINVQTEILRLSKVAGKVSNTLDGSEKVRFRHQKYCQNVNRPARHSYWVTMRGIAPYLVRTFRLRVAKP